MEARVKKLVVAGAIFSLIAATPAFAKDEKKDEPKAPQSVILDTVVLPVIVKGQLINYVFVSIRLELDPSADGAAVRNKQQYIRDDLVRASYRTPFTLATNYAKLDEAKIKAEIMSYAPSVIGAHAIRLIVITKQVSQKMRTLPPVDTAGGPPLIP
jgi:flagellar basal body-associated protein FliL